MKHFEIIEILKDWNFWEKNQNTGILRIEYLQTMKRFLGAGQVLTITGARRSGKSFLIKQLAKYLIDNGVKKENILIINFEDLRWPKIDALELQKIYEAYIEEFLPTERVYIFLDEIQEVENWEKWVRTMHELDKAQIIISGSNSNLLNSDLSALLTGRHLDIVVYPLSFLEFLSFNEAPRADARGIFSAFSGAKSAEAEDKHSFAVLRPWSSAKADKINAKTKALFNEYLKYGGFPKAVTEKEAGKEILISIFGDIIEKDIVKKYKIRQEEKLKSLAGFYLSNISSLVTFNKSGQFLGIPESTTERFSSYFENSYLLYFLKRYSAKFREQEKSPKKVYCVDFAMAKSIGFGTSRNLGKTAENMVFIELKRRLAKDMLSDLFYWKDDLHREVDFLIQKNHKTTGLIQVCWDLSDYKTKEREIKSLKLAMEQTNCKNGIILTEESEEDDIDGIKVIPLSKWLIS